VVSLLLEDVSAPVVHKVGGIAPKGAILRGKGMKKSKRAVEEQNNTKWAKWLNH